jgi:hypothetical protein
MVCGEPSVPSFELEVEIWGEFMPLFRSALEPVIGPNAASSDCQPERKSCSEVAFEVE